MVTTPISKDLASEKVLSTEELRKIHAYWRACNYLASGMIYLRDNPLLKEPLKTEHIKQRLLGHWGSSPALSFIYVHLNRLIEKYDLSALYIAGPGHGAPGVLGPVYLEGTYSENTPLELAILNQIDRFNLVIDVIDRVPKLGSRAAYVRERMRNEIIDSLAYAHSEGMDKPEMVNWTWDS